MIEMNQIMKHTQRSKAFSVLLPALLLSLSICGCTLMRSLPDIPGHAMRQAPPADIDAETLSVGAEAPAFELASNKGGSWSLGEHLAEGPVVLVFYRGYW